MAPVLLIVCDTAICAELSAGMFTFVCEDVIANRVPVMVVDDGTVISPELLTRNRSVPVVATTRSCALLVPRYCWPTPVPPAVIALPAVSQTRLSGLIARTLLLTSLVRNDVGDPLVGIPENVTVEVPSIVVNLPVLAELTPMAVPSINPPLISTLLNVCAPLQEFGFVRSRPSGLPVVPSPTNVASREMVMLPTTPRVPDTSGRVYVRSAESVPAT